MKLDMEKVKEFIANSTEDSAVYVGCDSVMKWNHKEKFLQPIYVIAVVIHIEQRKGAKVFHEIIRGDRIFGEKRAVLKQRLMKEVFYASKIAYEISDVVEDRVFEVHLDINSNERWESSIIIKEALGYVRGMGLIPVIKPDALAASSVADRVAVSIREDEKNPLAK